jgi:hypothetical protein
MTYFICIIINIYIIKVLPAVELVFFSLDVNIDGGILGGCAVHYFGCVNAGIRPKHFTAQQSRLLIAEYESWLLQ